MSIGVWIIEGNGVARAMTSNQSGNHTIGIRKPESRFITALYTTVSPRVSTSQKAARLTSMSPRKATVIASSRDSRPSG